MTGPKSPYVRTVGEFLGRVLADQAAHPERPATIHFELGRGLHDDGILWYPADAPSADRLAYLYSVSTLAFDAAVSQHYPAVAGWASLESVPYPDAATRPLMAVKWFHLISLDIAAMPRGATLRQALRDASRVKPRRIKVSLR
jgi:hypothetical protein